MWISRLAWFSNLPAMILGAALALVLIGIIIALAVIGVFL